MAKTIDMTKIIADKTALEHTIHTTNHSFNNLLDIAISNIAGGIPSPAPTTYQEKKKYIVDNMNIYDQKSKEAVKKIVEDRNTAFLALKENAKNLIEQQSNIISDNTILLNEMFQKTLEDQDSYIKLHDQKSKNSVLLKQCQTQENDISQEIQDLKDQLNDPNITTDQRQKMETELKTKEGKLTDLKKNIVEYQGYNSNIDSKLNTLKTNIKKQQKDHIDLKKENDKFGNFLVQNKNDFKRKFAEMGIEFNEEQTPNTPTPPNVEEKVTQTEPNDKEDKDEKVKDKSKGKGSAGGAVAASGSTGNKEARTSEEFSSDMAKAITSLGLSPRKFREMLDGEGYSDLVAMVPNLDPTQKRTIANYLKVNAKDLELPDEMKLNSAMTTFGLDNVPYDLLIDEKTGNARDFASLSNEELNELKSIINVFNEDADKLNAIEAKELDKFMKVISYHSLIYQCQKPNEKEISKGPFKGIRRFVQDVKVDKNSDRDITCRNIVGSMNEYLTKRNELTNDFRASLGENVNTEPTYIDMSGKDDIMKKAEERGYQTKKAEKKSDDPVK